MEKVFIVILNWNGKKDTLECLKSIIKLQSENYNRLAENSGFQARDKGKRLNTSPIKTPGILKKSIFPQDSCKLLRKTPDFQPGEVYKLEIVVVDNGSADRSVETIRNLKSKVKNLTLIENKKNLGFAGGNNVGIRYALENGADYVVVLNNDTIVPDNFLNLLENDAGIVGPVIRFKNDAKWVYDYGGYINWSIGRPKHFELPRYTTHPTLCTFDYLSGCCLFIKRKVFEKIGFFDEKYFLYFEDVDFCLRAKRAGFKIALDPKVIIFHKLGGAAGRWSKTSIFHNLRSNIIFTTKYLGWRRPIGYLYLTLLSIKIIFDRLILK